MSKLTKENRKRVKEIEQEIEKTMAQIKEIWDGAFQVHERVSTLSQEKDKLLDYDGFIAKKDAEIDKWRKRALDVEKRLEDNKKYRKKTDEIHFEIETPLIQLEELSEMVVSLSEPSHVMRLADEMTKYVKELSDIYYERNCTELKAVA